MQLLKYPFLWFEPRDTVNRLLLATNLSSDIQEITRSRQLIFAFASKNFAAKKLSRNSAKISQICLQYMDNKKTQSHASMQPALFGYFCSSSLKSNINFINKFPPHRIRSRVFFPLSINEKLKGEEVQSFIPLAQ